MSAVERNSYDPARRFAFLPRKGTIAVGADADPVAVDPNEEREVRHEGKGTCLWEGWRLRGSGRRVTVPDGERG